jgi:hypothetical protein
VFTVQTVRCVVALPLLVLGIKFGFTAVPLPWDATLGFVWRVLIVVIALQPLWLVGAFSKTTNDTSARWWFSFLAIGGIVTGLVGGTVLGVMLFVSTIVTDDPSPIVTLTCGALLPALSFGLMAFYGWAWGRGVFDLVAKPTDR